MAETIESFVAKLQAEGVEEGRKKAEKLKAEAEAQAQEVIRKAQADAQKIVADAEAEAEKLLARSKTELRLAARDTVFKLREALGRILESLLKVEVEEQLSSEEFLKTLIREVVSQYVTADREGKLSLQLTLPEDLRGSLESWIVGELQASGEQRKGGIDLEGTLQQAGFEVRTGRGTVEVTLESVVETLKEMVGVALRERLDRALKETED